MTHHAYIYEGSLSALASLAADARERFGFVGEHNPDVHVRELPKFGIDESRWLTQTASLKSSSGRALFVIGTGSMTSEAQQALLKLFEEPQAGLIFVLLVPHGLVLPTVRSRTAEYPTFETGAVKNSDAAVFLKASGKERSDLVAELLKDDEGARERARDLIDALEAELYKKISTPAARAGLADIAMVRSYLRDRSPSLKMLLEHLAIALPALPETASRGRPTV